MLKNYIRRKVTKEQFNFFFFFRTNFLNSRITENGRCCFCHFWFWDFRWFTVKVRFFFVCLTLCLLPSLLAQCSSAKIMLDGGLRGLINRSSGRLFYRMYSKYLPFKDPYIILKNSAGLRCLCLESMEVFRSQTIFQRDS